MSFRLKTIIGIAIIESILLLLLVVNAITFLNQSNKDQFDQRAKITAQLFSSAAKDAVIATDIATLETLIKEIKKNSDIDYVRISNEEYVLAESGSTEALEKKQKDKSINEVNDGIYDLQVDIREGDLYFGHIEIGLSTTGMENLLHEAKQWTISIAALEIILVAAFSFILGTYLTKQLLQLKNATKTIADVGPGHQIPITTKDEISDVIRSFNTMSKSLKNNYFELQHALKIEKEALSLAHEEKNKSDAIIKSSLDALITTDEKGHIVDYNHVAEDIFGWRLEDVAGKSIAEFIIPPHLREAHEQGMRHYLKTGEGPVFGKRLELPAIRKSGEEFPIEISISPIKTDHGDLFTAFIRDISEEKLNEENLMQARRDAEKASEAKGRFLASMSHEIRTPMNGILGVLGLIKDTSLNDKQKKMIKTARESGEHLLTIINDILDFSKMEADMMILEKTNFDIASVIKQVKNILLPQARKKGIELNYTIDNRLPAYLNGDPDRLRQILINLVGNAIKFTSEGYVSIHVSAVFDHQDSTTLTFAIKDSGIGIAPEHQKELFDEFTMADQTHSRKQEGTGLGLAICKRLVGLMGGDIHIDSALHKGSTFTVTIPFELGSEPEKTCTDNMDMSDSLHGARILLAEDNPTNQFVFKSILEKMDCIVDLAANGEEAVEAVMSLPYDLVLMDISMPIMDGIEATTIIRHFQNDRATIPIIALTAHALSGDRERFLSAGITDYLTKPINGETLISRISYWLEQRTTSCDNNEHLAIDDIVSSSEPIYVDVAVLRQLANDTSPELIPKLARMYTEDTENRVKKISQAIEACAFKTLEFETHALGSSAGAHGNTALFHLCREVEALCRLDNFDEAMKVAGPIAIIAKTSLDQLKQHVKENFRNFSITWGTGLTIKVGLKII